MKEILFDFCFFNNLLFVILFKDCGNVIFVLIFFKYLLFFCYIVIILVFVFFIVNNLIVLF